MMDEELDMMSQPAFVAPQKQADPSAIDWERARSTIHKYYIHDKLTGAQVVQKMATDHDFHATLRMFKDRFRKWGFDCKTIREAVWNEMYLIYVERRDRYNKDTEFFVNLYDERKRIDYGQIKKHMNRSRPFLADRDKARSILDRFNVKAYTPPGSPRTLPLVQPIDINIHSTRSIQSTWGSPGSSLTGYSPNESSIDSSGSDQENSRNRARRRIPRQHDLHHALRPPYHNRTLPALQHILVLTTPTVQIQPGLDITRLFGEVSLSITIEYDEMVKKRVANYSGCRKPQRSSHQLQDHEKIAGEWIINIFLTCYFHDQGDMLEADRCRQKALDFQTRLLHQPSHHFLPGFLWVNSMMLAHGHVELLGKFSEDCAKTIATMPNGNVRYAQIISFCRAVLDGQEDMAEQYISPAALENADREHAGFALAWGEDSPNALVSSYYHAWYLLRNADDQQQHRFDEGEKLMHSILSRAELVMGSEHPVTVSCLATLSRAYGDCGQDAKAIEYVKDAISRSTRSWGGQHPFSLKLQRRLAMLHRRAGDLRLAEQILWEVVRGRVELLRLGNAITWAAIEDLGNVLAEQGKEMERVEMLRDFDMQYQRDGSILAPSAMRLDRPW